MIFTREMLEEIRRGLANLGIRDTEIERLNQNNSPLTGNETFVLVKNGINVRVTLNEIYAQFPDLAEAIKEAQKNINIDIFNVSSYSSDKGGDFNFTLEDAIDYVPEDMRKLGLYITFCNIDNEWETYQMIGESIEDEWDVNHFINYHKELQEQIDDINNSKGTFTLNASRQLIGVNDPSISRQTTLTLSSSVKGDLRIKTTNVLAEEANTNFLSYTDTITSTTTYIGELIVNGSVKKTSSITVYAINRMKYYAGLTWNEANATSNELTLNLEGDYDITIPEGGGYIYFWIPTLPTIPNNYELTVTLNEEISSPITMEESTETTSLYGKLWRSDRAYDEGTYQFTLKIK